MHFKNLVWRLFLVVQLVTLQLVKRSSGGSAGEEEDSEEEEEEDEDDEEEDDEEDEEEEAEEDEEEVEGIGLFFTHMLHIWNRLPHQIRSAESLAVFKKTSQIFPVQ